MVTLEAITEPKLAVVDRHCNKCGVSCKNGDYGYEGLVDATVRGGYGSEFPGDLIYIQFDLCSKCVKALVETFQIPVELKELIRV